MSAVLHVFVTTSVSFSDNFDFLCTDFGAFPSYAGSKRNMVDSIGAESLDY